MYKSTRRLSGYYLKCRDIALRKSFTHKSKFISDSGNLAPSGRYATASMVKCHWFEGKGNETLVLWFFGSLV